MEKDPLKINVMLSFEEKKRLTDFFLVLIAIDKRVNAQRPKEKKKRKSKDNQRRARNCGPCFLTAITLPLNHLVYIQC
jgi:hypothetical protein